MVSSEPIIDKSHLALCIIISFLTCLGFFSHTSPYHPHLPYLLFPPSDQFLVFVAIGWLRIKNTSPSDPVELVAQKRISSEVGKTLVLEANSERIISYKYVNRKIKLEI